MITASPAMSSLTSMMNAVVRAMGHQTFSGSGFSLSRMIVERVRDLGNALLIVDEAQHLISNSIEEIRSWHDETGLGIALLGNAGLLQSLEGGSRSIARAQLFSRISLKLVRTHPLHADVEAMLDAWRITDARLSEYIHTIAQRPGGLRGATFTIELAHMIAAAAREDLNVSHLQDAWAQLSMRAVAT